MLNGCTRNETIKVNFGRKNLQQQKKKYYWLHEHLCLINWAVLFFVMVFLILHVQNTDPDNNMQNIAHFRVFCVRNGQFVGILVLEYSLTKCLSLIENSRQNCISTSQRNQMSFVILMAVFALSVTICHIHMLLSQNHSFHLPLAYTILMCFRHNDFG